MQKQIGEQVQVNVVVGIKNCGVLVKKVHANRKCTKRSGEVGSGRTIVGRLLGHMNGQHHYT